MADNPYGFELDDRDPCLFQYPQERRVLLKRPDGVDLILTVKLAYEDGALRAAVTSARRPFSGAENETVASTEYERSCVQQMVLDFFRAEPFAAG